MDGARRYEGDGPVALWISAGLDMNGNAFKRVRHLCAVQAFCGRANLKKALKRHDRKAFSQVRLAKYSLVASSLSDCYVM